MVSTYIIAYLSSLHVLPNHRDTSCPSTEVLSTLFDLLDEQINLKNIYPNIESEAPYRLKGMVRECKPL